MVRGRTVSLRFGNAYACTRAGPPTVDHGESAASLARTMSFIASSLRASRLPPISYARPVRPAVCTRRCLATTAVLRAEPEASTSGGSTAAEPKPEETQTSQDTPTSQADSPKEQKDILPFLGRPLGLKYPPTTVPKTWTEEMMDEEPRKDHREKL